MSMIFENNVNVSISQSYDSDVRIQDFLGTNLSKLKSRAESATKEQWQCKKKRFFAHDEAEAYVSNGQYIIARCPQGQHDAEFIAAANPRMILQIVELLQKRQQMLETITKQNLELEAECAKLKDEILKLKTQNITNQYKLNQFTRWYNILSKAQKETINDGHDDLL